MAEQAMDDQGVLRKVISRKEAIERGLGRYFTGKKCKYGHVSERYVTMKSCIACVKENKKEYYRENSEKIKEYKKEYYQENAEKLKERMKEYYQENAEKLKERMKEYYQENSEKFKVYFKEYREQNKEYWAEYREQNKEMINEHRRQRYSSDPNFKTAEVCRRMLKRTLKATSSTKDSRTYEALGYCNEELKQNIESKFLQGMSWENHGEWHIDHKYPVSRYIQDGITDPKIINSLDNLIPMWDDHNMSKSAMTLEEFIEQEEELAEMYGEFLETI